MHTCVHMCKYALCAWIHTCHTYVYAHVCRHVCVCVCMYASPNGKGIPQRESRIKPQTSMFPPARALSPSLMDPTLLLSRVVGAAPLRTFLVLLLTAQLWAWV